eukprot:6227995-Prymnesium_polylepis.1
MAPKAYDCPFARAKLSVEQEENVKSLTEMGFAVRAKEAIVMAVGIEQALDFCQLSDESYSAKRKAHINQDKQLRSKQHGVSLRSGGAAAAAASLKPVLQSEAPRELIGNNGQRQASGMAIVRQALSDEDADDSTGAGHA